MYEQSNYPCECRVTRLIFVETGSYDDMAIRPFETQIDQGAIQAVAEATDNGTRISAQSLAGVGGMIIRPRTKAEGYAHIANGFGESRFRFLMEVEVSYPTGLAGAGRREYITGYTDYLGVIEGRDGPLLDEKMTLFFNSVNVVRDVVDTQATGMGAVQRSTGIYSAQVLSGSQYTPSYDQGRDLVAMRPVDLFSHLGTRQYTAGHDGVIDLSNDLIGGDAIMSRRDNNYGTSYLARAVQAMYMAMELADDDFSADQATIARSAKTNTKERSYGANDFFNKINRRYGGPVASNTVTYGDLLALEPGLDRYVEVNMAKRVNRVSTAADHRGQFERWDGELTETIAATVLNASLPSLMTDLLMTKVHFTATNNTVGGEFEIMVVDQRGFARGVDMRPYLRQFVHRMRTEILPEISMNGNLEITIEMSADLVGDTKIEIQVNGGPVTPFMSPQFCDALYANVLSFDPDSREIMADDIVALTDNVRSIAMPEKSTSFI